ncbi:MAG: nuclear transport factor 2 family protein [Cyclobacteriaceae bacterium]|nr:nuclear transport factor 2 family protein [Cyclobacteriaceae bacterium]
MNTIQQKISEEFSKGNFQFAFEYLSENIQWNIIGNKILKGKDEVIEWCTEIGKEMSDTILKNKNSIIGDSSIAIQGYCDYTTPDNQPGRVSYCDVFQFRNEKIEEITSYAMEDKI